MADLKLYYMSSCPYCQKVLGFMNSENIVLDLKDTSDDNIRNELLEINGRSQVPCLVIDGSPLLESDDIIQWLKDN